METSIQTSLCKGLRACGFPKSETLELVNTIAKWYDSSGPEWTNQRMKDLKMWYETYLAGNPSPPPWFRHTKENLPIGIFSKVFRTRNVSKVLAVLSANTVFKNKEMSDSQREKFLNALNADTLGDSLPGCLDTVQEVVEGIRKPSTHLKVPRLTLPTFESMTATSIPIGDRSTLRVTSQEDRERAYVLSWNSVPEATLQLLDDLDHLDWIPTSLFLNGNDLTLKEGSQVVGRIGLIQEPALKLRSVANPNRIAQHFTHPLGRVWEQVLSFLPTDCTFDQESGVDWVQRQLKQGISLSSSDLSSATDLLSLGGSVGVANSWTKPLLRDEDMFLYEKYVEYFEKLSRSKWFVPDGQGYYVQWNQGQPLGLYPSFRLLAIVNNTLGIVACKAAGLESWKDSFRVIGDDIIIRSEAAPYYEELVTQFGGEINRTKTLVSDKVAEFAGRIVFPDKVSLKTYKFKDPSDMNFMSYMSDLGPQAKSILLPRQQKAWEYAKYVPGYVVPGPWSKDSYGVPLESRLGWYLTSSQLFSEGLPEPDPQYYTGEEFLLKVRLRSEDLMAKGVLTTPIWCDDEDPDWNHWVPIPWDEDYPSSEFRFEPRSSGDPRRQGGLTVLEDIEGAIQAPSSKDFPSYQEEHCSSRKVR